MDKKKKCSRCGVHRLKIVATKDEFYEDLADLYGYCTTVSKGGIWSVLVICKNCGACGFPSTSGDLKQGIENAEINWNDYVDWGN